MFEFAFALTAVVEKNQYFSTKLIKKKKEKTIKVGQNNYMTQYLNN